MAKKKITQTENNNRIDNFNKRWNVTLNENDRWNEFKQRILNYYVDNFTCNEDTQGKEFLRLIGIHKKPIYPLLENFIGEYKDSIYDYLSSTTEVTKMLLGIELIFYMKTLNNQLKDCFYKEIKNIIIITGVSLEIKKVSQDVFLYPSGVRLFDESLVNDNLDWLSKYPKSYEAYKNALMNYEKSGEERNVVDNLRLALEILLKDILNNRKSLENQKNEIGNLFKNKNISTDISNMFITILSFYTNYQNDKAKHNYSVSSKEVEFILYLTGTFMRFILTI